MDPRIYENLGRLRMSKSQLQPGAYEDAREDDLDLPECILQLMFDVPWDGEGPFFAEEGDQERVEVLFVGPEEFDEDLDPETVEEHGELVVFAQLAGEERLLLMKTEDDFGDPIFYVWDPDEMGSDEALIEIGDFDSLLSSLHRDATDVEEEDVDGLDEISDIDFDEEPEDL